MVVKHTTLFLWLNRNISTISRELNKNFPQHRRYSAWIAQERANENTLQRGRKLRLKNQRIRDYVHQKLRMGWSQEQIAGRLTRDHPNQSISHEAIYQYIYLTVNIYRINKAEDDLRIYLRRSYKRRRHRSSHYTKRSVIPNRIGIEQRAVIGHWEDDTVLSGKKVWLVCRHFILGNEA